MSEETQVVKVPEAKVGPMGIEVQNLEQMWWLSGHVMRSGMAPKDCKSTADLVIRAQYGMSVGLSFMQAIQCVANVNGRPSLWGHQVLGLITASGKCKSWTESIIGTDPTKDDYTVRITTERRDIEGIRVVEFSVAEARRANLMGKDLYKTYPKDMIRHRAVARAAKQVYADVLSGLGVAEEERDIIDITSEPVEPAAKPANLSDVAEAVKRRGRPAKPVEAVVEPADEDAPPWETATETEAPII
jgi:hypothetical protein